MMPNTDPVTDSALSCYDGGGHSQPARPWSAVLVEFLVVMVLLTLHWSMGYLSSRHMCNTVDEITHISNGYSYWLRNDYRLHAENGNFPQRWMTLPLLAKHYAFPGTEDGAWKKSDQHIIAHRFFYGMGNNADEMLARARGMIRLLAVLLGVVVYAWSRRFFGVRGGLISLFLFSFSPTMLAHGNLATTDLAAALFFTTSTWAWWALLQKISPVRLLACCLSVAGLFLSKMTAVLFVPAAVILVVLRLRSRDPLVVAFGSEWERRFSSTKERLAVVAGIAVLHVVILVLAIYTSFGFRYEAMGPSASLGDSFSVPWETLLGQEPHGLAAAVNALRIRRWLPEGYLYCMASVLQTTQTRSAFLNGYYSSHGWRYFFPYVFMVKTPLSLFALFALLALEWRRRKVSGKRVLLRTAPIWILLAVYWTFSIASRLNIGHRHLLPVYPLLFVLAGACGGCWEPARRLRMGLALILIAFATESLAIQPHYLSFFNTLGGGPRRAYRHLVDSSLDWGQDLPSLKRWLQQMDFPASTPVYLSYFGTASPDYYGLNVRLLPGCPDIGRKPDLRALEPGVYCVSATMLQQVYSRVPGPWTPQYESAYQSILHNAQVFERLRRDSQADQRLVRGRAAEIEGQMLMFEHLRLARLCAHLRRRQPDAYAGYSILIYDVTAAELNQALSGPI